MKKSKVATFTIKASVSILYSDIHVYRKIQWYYMLMTIVFHMILGMFYQQLRRIHQDINYDK